ncbi:MAG: hypothetical protein BAJALOKI3v1_20007 [Promethearchaeota archaeon]|nr:MAG: hypothetical protein BAJALOKI3v1_20007 [Candidatus Lokiarchaeota archaeon]
MNFQYYKTLLDKSKETLFALIEEIVPNILELELALFLGEVSLKKLKQENKSPFDGSFIEVDFKNEKDADLSKLNKDQFKKIYETFISKEKNDKDAIKWRFFKFLKTQKDISIKSVHIRADTKKDDFIDYIIEIKENRHIFINCNYILDKEYYFNAGEKIAKFSKEIGKIPNKVIFSTYKTYRDIPIDDKFIVRGNDVEQELWVEWNELEKPFNGEDLLIVLVNNEKEMEVAGFNFSSIENLLDYIYKYSNGGQIAIYKQQGFFSESYDGKSQIELIWKGIMLKNKFK